MNEFDVIEEALFDYGYPVKARYSDRALAIKESLEDYGYPVQDSNIEESLEVYGYPV